MNCRNCKTYGSSPIPEEGKYIQSKDIKDISGFSHGCGACAPQQGTCKLTLNVKNGIIKEALIETIGCSGMTHSGAMACEILIGKTILEALNTDLVCDAINVAMREIFLQLVYGRSQSAYTENGLEIGSGIEDLGKHKSSNVSTVYSSENGPRYLQLAEGYITRQALDKNGEIIGYEYINTNLLVELLENGEDNIQTILQKCKKTYGRFDEGVHFINPRKC